MSRTEMDFLSWNTRRVERSSVSRRSNNFVPQLPSGRLIREFSGLPELGFNTGTFWRVPNPEKKIMIRAIPGTQRNCRKISTKLPRSGAGTEAAGIPRAYYAARSQSYADIRSLKKSSRGRVSFVSTRTFVGSELEVAG